MNHILAEHASRARGNRVFCSGNTSSWQKASHSRRFPQARSGGGASRFQNPVLRREIFEVDGPLQDGGFENVCFYYVGTSTLSMPLACIKQ